MISSTRAALLLSLLGVLSLWLCLSTKSLIPAVCTASYHILVVFGSKSKQPGSHFGHDVHLTKTSNFLPPAAMARDKSSPVRRPPLLSAVAPPSLRLTLDSLLSRRPAAASSAPRLLSSSPAFARKTPSSTFELPGYFHSPVRAWL